MILRPEQRLRKSEKDKDWKERNVNYWAGRANLYPVVNSDAIALYLAAAGKLDESVYTYVTNPLNTSKPNLKGYPARMRNIDIISTNIQMYLGELGERLFNPIVVAINSDLQSTKEKKEFELNLTQLKQQFVNGLVQEGLLPEQIAQTPLPDEIIRKTISNLKDQLAIMGQQAIDYILQDKKVDRIRRQTFYDFIVLGRFFTYKDVKNGDIVYEYVSPLELSFSNTPGTYFVEDAEAVKRGVTLPFSEIVDTFSDVEGFQELLPEIEAKISTIGYQSIYTGITTDMLRGDLSQPFSTQTEGLFVEHVNWSSLKLMKKVSGVDPFGNSYVEHYDEDYEPLPNEQVEEYWVTEKWEGWRIDTKWVIGVQPIPFQRGTYENPNECKNLYNGRIWMNNYILPQSIVEKGIVYQIKYNIVHYQLEKILNKNKDKLVAMPLGAIPQKEGWDEFTTMYYADAHGFLFLDETNPQTLAALQYMKSIDLSLTQYIKEMYGILRQIKEDWDESIGVTRQRKGQNMASDGKAVNEEAIGRSVVVSEEFFKQHEETIVADLQGLLDLSKIAWANGKKGSYVNSDFKNVQFELDPTVYPFSVHGIFVENSSKTTRQVQMMQQQLGNIAQQTNNLSILPRIAQATNLSKLTEQIDEIEEKFNKQQQAQQEAEQQLKQAELADKESDRQLKIYEIDENNLRARDVALINAESAALSYQESDEGTTDVALLEKLANERNKNAEAFRMERLKLKEQARQHAVDTKITRENMKNDKEIALINARNRNKKTK